MVNCIRKVSICVYACTLNQFLNFKLSKFQNYLSYITDEVHRLTIVLSSYKPYTCISCESLKFVNHITIYDTLPPNALRRDCNGKCIE